MAGTSVHLTDGLDGWVLVDKPREPDEFEIGMRMRSTVLVQN